MSSNLTIREQALAEIKKDEIARLATEKAAQMAEAAATAERERLAREARIIAAAERQQALLRAERLEAEEAAASQAAAEKTALAAEVERLRARTPLEVLQDEMAQVRAEMALLESSKEEHAAASNEITELKRLVHALIMQQASGFWNVGSSAASDNASATLKEYVRLINPQRMSEREQQRHQTGRENMRLD